MAKPANHHPAADVIAAKAQEQMNMVNALSASLQALADLNTKADQERAALELKLAERSRTALEQAESDWRKAEEIFGASWLKKQGFKSPSPTKRRRVTKTNQTSPHQEQSVPVATEHVTLNPETY